MNKYNIKYTFYYYLLTYYMKLYFIFFKLKILFYYNSHNWLWSKEDETETNELWEQQYVIKHKHINSEFLKPGFTKLKGFEFLIKHNNGKR